ncbi:MAG: branched-chain amino acid ABC transporter ATP-binding protein [Rhizobiales bacterium 24-66-13]|jgi:branched-chain amino acid transport system ATP-binding protein|nr:MAG: branched-chain amino acid ABC transporter ATP-binding protein [Rhizobiales bacterium 35-66-30]OYZ79022.1 MAG: branched-chain amino acid ABC transporter ATP-binding protein [Rhizobiales bacterium 24-66-13]OZB04001.1 MAG: branched-chain amino acid ABC transporter ATP-binding protein [Rhizobiales bacterium 39-66-18]HQS08981.1 ABC transporter ATP-binding protein [Xanthobacteraceae bacterium]HQS49200.1 ABC transporter ATP-binding protein [Xanthobacteraceae bacterium]
MSTPALEVRDLWSGYGDQDVLRGIDLVLEPRTIVALIGANGAGKSTLLRTLSGLLRPHRGEAKLYGESIFCLPPHKVVERGFVQSPEGKQLFLGMSIRENLLVGAQNKRARARRDQTLEEVFELFPILRERQALNASTLSGGQQQMVAVGRALMALPRVLALDEPSLGLAPIMVDRLFESIAKIKERDLTILIIEQNVFQVLEMADYGYVLENGVMTLNGTGAELLADDHLRASYLGL